MNEKASQQLAKTTYDLVSQLSLAQINLTHLVAEPPRPGTSCCGKTSFPSVFHYNVQCLSQTMTENSLERPKPRSLLLFFQIFYKTTKKFYSRPLLFIDDSRRFGGLNFFLFCWFFPRKKKKKPFYFLRHKLDSPPFFPALTQRQQK